ncbi:hypothetical protein [Botrimarina mediterranea]|uniref:hypothetical protein n=1 Tax=Botrimarina mediterranea TaxID=2528022 RepID=UPI0011886323|nr:periplasmic folding chaperone [Planctomycetes bacterium K2D]
MATPLTTFSKYSGALMAVLCVLLMFSFVIGDPLMQYAGGGSDGPSGGNEVVARWNGGKINERQLDQAVMHRNILASFQQAVYVLGARDAEADGVQDLGLRVMPIEFPRTPEEGVERDVVAMKIFAERAREAGMVVSDEMIIDYLRALGRDRVSNNQMRDILSNMKFSGGQRATIAFIFDLLRESMLANNYRRSYLYAFQTILPEERWEDWKTVNERVVVEAAPLKTEDFVAEAPEPTEAELEEFFELYKLRTPTTEPVLGVELPSAVPAFATPERVKLAVLRADFNAVVEEVTPEVTEEQIASFYEENKESFIQADRALFGDDSLFGSDDLTVDEPSDESSEAPATEEGSEEGAEEATDEESAMEEPAADEPAAEEAAEDDAESEEATAAEEGEEAPPANPLRSGDAAGEAVEEEEEEEEQPAADEGAADEADETADDGPEADDTNLYQPLDEVKEEIRRRLAIDLAVQRITEKMNRIKRELDDAFYAYEDELLRVDEKNANAKKPAVPSKLTDLKPLAEAEQLELIEVDQASRMELRETPVGGSFTIDAATNSAIPLWYTAFLSEELPLYQPLLTRDPEGNNYLTLVTERYPGVTPKLEDVREQVVAAWKRQKAAELALKKAEELAKQASDKGGSLTDFFAAMENPPVASDDIKETDAFAYLTIGRIAPNSRQVPLQMSQPEPLVAAGPELLQGVFELKPGQVGAELNHDHSLAYVLRIAERIGSEEELRREFLRDGDRWLGAEALNTQRARTKVMALVGNLLEESGLEWERTPDELR